MRPRSREAAERCIDERCNLNLVATAARVPPEKIVTWVFLQTRRNFADQIVTFVFL